MKTETKIIILEFLLSIFIMLGVLGLSFIIYTILNRNGISILSLVMIGIIFLCGFFAVIIGMRKERENEK